MTEQEINQYNHRQIALMESRIALYRNNQLSIKQFIDDTDALIAWIKNPPSDWVRSLKGLLWEVEIIYAWALDQKKDLTVGEFEQISQYVNKIEELVIWYKQNCILPLNNEEC